MTKLVTYSSIKIKYWQKYYLVKRIEKHFDKINIGDLYDITIKTWHTYIIIGGLNIGNFG